MPREFNRYLCYSEKNSCMVYTEFFLIGVTGIEPARSWSQTKRLTIGPHPDINIQLWSKLWSAFIFHVRLARKQEKKRESRRKHDLHRDTRLAGDLLPEHLLYQLSHTPYPILYRKIASLSTSFWVRILWADAGNFSSSVDFSANL